MAETTADVRRDIELTRERMSDTLAELEKRLNAMEMVRQHPWPAIALAAGAGFVLSGTRADVKAAAATASLAHGAGHRAGRIGPLFDELLARLVNGVQDVVMERADEMIGELRTALGGGPLPPRPQPGPQPAPQPTARHARTTAVSAGGAGNGAGGGMSSASPAAPTGDVAWQRAEGGYAAAPSRTD